MCNSFQGTAPFAESPPPRDIESSYVAHSQSVHLEVKSCDEDYDFPLVLALILLDVMPP